MCRHSDFLKGVIVTFCIYTHSDAKILTQITLYANPALSKALNTFRNLEQSDITACKRLYRTMAFCQWEHDCWRLAVNNNSTDI